MQSGSSGEWFYVGHYGQLGPLTLEQVTELVRDGVILPDTFVWRSGMADWRPAREVSDLTGMMTVATSSPPPPLLPGLAAPSISRPAASYASAHPAPSPWSSLESAVPVSDKTRLMAGLLNLIPGVGRLYLGYAAHGVLQIFTALFCGIGFIWSIIDGIYILAGGVKYDGYGRLLRDE